MPRPAEDRDALARRLTAGIARGDRACLDEFYRHWFDRCYTLARSLTGRDESFSMDVVQEAMLRVVRGCKAMPGEADLDRWMTRVVHTAALDLLRRESRRVSRERRAARTQTGPPAAAIDERIVWIRQRLGELPARDGWLVWLRLARGKTLEQAGAAAGITGDAAHGRIRRTVEQLRQAESEAAHD